MHNGISPRRQLTIPNFSSLGYEMNHECFNNRNVYFSEENQEIFKTNENFLQYTARILHEGIKTPRFISDNHIASQHSQCEDVGLENIEECTNESEQIKRIKLTPYYNTVKIGVGQQDTLIKLESNPTQDSCNKDSCSKKFACGCFLF